MDKLPNRITYFGLVLVCLLASGYQNSYGQSLRPRSSSKLTTGKWYKISIDKSGVYKLDYKFLTDDLKISKDDLTISKLGVFGYGGGALPEDNTNFNIDLPEHSIEVVDINGNDKLEENDYILFYAAGPFRWTYNSSNNLFEHTSAFYSDVQHFFLSTTEGSNKRVAIQNLSGSPTRIHTSYDFYDVSDKDSINPKQSGRIWFSSSISNFKKRIEQKLPLTTCAGGENVWIRFAYFTELNNIPLSISIDGTTIKTINLLQDNKMQYDSIKISCPSSTPIIAFTISSPITSEFYLDFIEVNTKATLNFSGSQYNFRIKDGFNTGDIKQVQIANGSYKVWNVTDGSNVKSVTLNSNGSGSNFLLNNFKIQEFVIFDNSLAYSPKAIGVIENQNLLDAPHTNNIIIVPKAWKSVGDELALFHKENSGIASLVVDVEKIYNEFSSGNKDVTGIRRFLVNQYLKSPSTTNTLSTVLFFGKACVDYKNIMKGSCEDIVPTYETNIPSDFLQSFCTDDYFGLLDINETNLDNPIKNLNIGIGRIPVNSLSEAKEALAKIKAYKSKQSFGDWRNISTTTADDYDDPPDASFYIQNEKVLSAYIKNTNVKTNQNKIYLDAFRQEQFSGGQRYEDAEKLLKDNFSFGSLLITYVGHGGFSNWAQERILSVSDLPIYKNLNSLPFLTTATCGFAPYDKPNKDKSAGERYLLQKDGGAIALLTTCREVYISDQGPFMRNFIKNFYTRKSNGNFLSFGDISKLTKNSNGMDLNSQKVVLLGDPALILNMPYYNIVTTSVSNGTDDTLKSLSKIKIKGEVQDLTNLTIADFNGFCQVTVFDKKTKNRLNYNDGNDPIPGDTFEVQESRIFRGSTNVINGKFEIEFIVPKDINYSMGLGRISYYAADTNTKPSRDASGMDTTIWVGGANLNAATDEKPPVVILFMNDDKFVYGGITNADPILLAKISDESGINTTGAGIGHDITAILDNNTRIPIILNNYYRSEAGNFTQGRINYPFYQLADGKHTIKVKAWDVYNNPGEGYTEFIVAKSEGIALRHVLNYPNPFTTNTWFQFEHNRPNEPIDVTINIMTVSGKVVKRIHQKMVTEGFRVDKQIAWNGKDDFGDPIGRGMYVYVVTIRDTKGEIAYQYEKLVILQ